MDIRIGGGFLGKGGSGGNGGGPVEVEGGEVVGNGGGSIGRFRVVEEVGVTGAD